MKSITSLLVSALFLLFLVQCGQKDEEVIKQEEAKKEIIEQAKADSIKEVKEIEAAAAAEQAKLEAERIEKERLYVEFDENGPITLQVEAWRSEDGANNSAEKWKKRGFPNAYVVQHGDSASGDVWFRVRLARFANRTWAKKQASLLQEKYKGMQTWVTSYSATETTASSAE